jgi:uncharacterized protein (TIGR02596 family)
MTLMEILVVLAVMIGLMAIAIPSITSSSTATKLTSAGQMLVDELNLARQTAVTRNAPVEVRFYKLPPANGSESSAPQVYRAFQVFVVGSSGPEELGKVRILPTPVIFTLEDEASPFLENSDEYEERTPADSDPELPRFKSNYVYKSLVFTPGGSASVSSNEGTFTLAVEQAPKPTEGANFFSVQVNPVTGSVRWFRP